MVHSWYFCIISWSQGSLGRAGSPGASGWGSLCSTWWGEWGERGLVLSQALRTPLSCRGLSVPTRPLEGQGWWFEGPGNRWDIKYFGTMALPSLSIQLPPTHTHTHSWTKYFHFTKTAWNFCGYRNHRLIGRKKWGRCKSNYSGPVPPPALVSFPNLTSLAQKSAFFGKPDAWATLVGTPHPTCIWLWPLPLSPRLLTGNTLTCRKTRQKTGKPI